MKPYDVGLVCGRFQTFHKGHEKLVDTGLLLCDRLLILIGSAQESGTERNQYTDQNPKRDLWRSARDYDLCTFGHDGRK